MARRRDTDDDAEAMLAEIDAETAARSGEAGMVLWISIGLGTVAGLPTLSGVMDGSVSPMRGATWFLVTTLIALVGVWTVVWLMHVFSDDYPDAAGSTDEPADSAVADDAPTSTAAPDPTDAPATGASEPAPSELAESGTP